jgi:hypothetical protein
VEGNPRSLATGRKHRMLALYGQGAATVGTSVAVLGLCECARVHCMGPCMGSVRPSSHAGRVCTQGEALGTVLSLGVHM